MRTFAYDRAAAAALARLYTITTPTGQTIRFTGASHDITIGGITWTAAAGLIESALVFRGDGSVTNSEIHLTDYSGSPIAGTDVARGVYEGVTITVAETDFTSSTQLLSGFTGNLSINRPGVITLEARGPLTRARAVISEKYSPMGREQFGDDRCRIPVNAPDIGRNQRFVIAANATSVASYAGRMKTASAGNPTDYADVFYECTGAGVTAGSAPTYNSTVGAVTLDGSVVFTTSNAWLRAAQVATIVDSYTFTVTSLPDPRASVDGWFTLGIVYNRTAPNNGFAAEVLNWIAGTLTVACLVPIAGFININDWIEIARGCDKTQTVCNSIFANILNRRAETFAPGRDLALASL